LIIPLVAGMMYVLVSFGYPAKSLKSNLSEVMLIVQICLTSALTYYLLKRYSNYLLSDCWRAKFVNYLSVGLKWSIPLLILHIISLSIPSIRGKLIEDYLSMKIIMVKGISNFSLIIFSIWIILGAIFEEFYFRGIILQKLRGILNRTLSVFIAAGLFALAHFIFSPLNIGDLTSIVFVGLLCGFAFTSTGSCISAIVPHLINNAICIAIVSIIR
jgi:membrane protease YdiL (CAAX protease family)